MRLAAVDRLSHNGRGSETGSELHEGGEFENLESWIREHLFEVVPSAVAIIDTDWRLVMANSLFEERFGEWRGRRCYEVYKGQKRRCSRCVATRSFVDGKVRARAERGLDRKGRPTHYIVRVAPVVRPDGSVPYMVKMSTDVTREVLLESELARANTLHETLIEASGNAIVALDTRGIITHWNPAAEQLFGWEPNEVLGREPPEGLLPPGCAEAARRGEVLTVPEMRAKRQDGHEVPVGFHGVPLVSDGQPMGRAAFFQDLSEVKQLEREKMDVERLAAVGQTVAGLAHGVKNILTGLEGGLYLMRSGLDRKKEARLRDGFAMLERNVGRVGTFVRTLLDFSKGRTPAVHLLDPVALAWETVALYREAASNAGISLTVEAPSPVEPAGMDLEAIRTCLENLVTNALDACRMSEKPEKHVVLRVFEEVEPTPAWRPAAAPRSALVLEVRDDGIGMEYEVKRKVFTNFFTTKGEGGTGLGLLMTRKIVQEHGGSIDVESEAGQGTVFRLRFPRRRLPPLTPPEGAPNGQST